MVWLSGLLPYEQCAAVFERIGERPVSASSIWRQTDKHGERLQCYVEEQQEQVRVERIQLPDARHDHDQRKGVSMGGWGDGQYSREGLARVQSGGGI